ncbi:amino acid ABC transporter permease [Paenibacillus filicis]|uniref:Amino acid ABC transporter permease n=1 Tax=Paenibacillus filicis TaxID=669464 RepID=A0ABU9DM30_9BACL
MGQAFDIQLIGRYFWILLEYLPVSLTILFFSLVLGGIVGALLAVPRLYKWPVADGLCAAYISFFRATPIIIQLILIFYVLPELLKAAGLQLPEVPPAVYVVLTFGLNNGASLAEIFRASVNSVDRGQSEAAASVGLSGWDSFMRIILPQALRVAMPHLSNVVISSLKDTSLAFSVGVMDMMGRGEAIGRVYFHMLEVYISLAIIYYAVCLLLQYFFGRAERRLQRHERALTGT